MRQSGFKFSLTIISLVLVSGYGGYYIGNLKAERTFESLFNLDESNKLVASVQTLSAIRFGNQDLAIRLLEGRVDTSLMILNWRKKVETEQEKPVLDSLRLASVYREYYKDEYKAVFGKEKLVGAGQIQEALSYGSKLESSAYDNFIKKYLAHK